MVDIVQYTDYRRFLRDYFDDEKKRNPKFSYTVFSRKAGIKSRGFLYNVVHGKRSLSKSHMFALSKCMKLDKHRTEYLETLVAFNEAVSMEERNYFFERLCSIKSKGTNGWEPQRVRMEQFQYYSKVHNGVIRSLIDMRGFDGDYEKLAKMVRPAITAKEARQAVILLENLGFILKDKKGAYHVKDKSIATEPDVLSIAVHNFHQEAGRLGLQALEKLPKQERNITGCMLGISKKTYENMCEEIRLFRRKLIQRAEMDENADTVYQVNFHFFPLSATPEKKETP